MMSDEAESKANVERQGVEIELVHGWISDRWKDQNASRAASESQEKSKEHLSRSCNE